MREGLAPVLEREVPGALMVGQAKARDPGLRTGDAVEERQASVDVGGEQHPEEVAGADLQVEPGVAQHELAPLA